MDQQLQNNKDHSILNKKLVIWALVIYSIGLIWILFFRCSIPFFWNQTFPNIFSKAYHEFNFIPFNYFIKEDHPAWYNFVLTAFNLILFILPTFLIESLFKKPRYYITAIIIIVVTTALEAIQYFTYWGVFDLTDILLYCVGMAIALIVYKVTYKKANWVIVNKILFISNIVGSVVSIVAIGLMVPQILQLCEK